VSIFIKNTIILKNLIRINTNCIYHKSYCKI